MTHDEVVDFLEAYRDGVIDEANARRLAETIRQGGQTAQWIMHELAFTGWICQALESLDDDSFVRSFLERLYAEKSGADFQKAFSERFAEARRRPEFQRRWSWRQRLLPWTLLGSQPLASSGLRRARLPWRQMLRFGAVLAAIALGAWFVFTRLDGLRVMPVGLVIEASPGVVVLHGNQRQPLEAGMEMFKTESVSVPVNGHLVVRNGSTDLWRFRSGTMATFVPVTLPMRHFVKPEGRGIFLQTGELVAEQTILDGRAHDYVMTPHGVAEITTPVRFSLAVTAASSRLEVESGNLTFIRHRDGRRIILNADFYLVATEESELIPIRLSSQR